MGKEGGASDEKVACGARQDGSEKSIRRIDSTGAGQEIVGRSSERIDGNNGRGIVIYNIVVAAEVSDALQTHRKFGPDYREHM